MARTRRAGRRIKRGGVSQWYAKAAAATADLTKKADVFAQGHAKDSHEKAKIAVAETSKKNSRSSKRSSRSRSRTC